MLNYTPLFKILKMSAPGIGWYHLAAWFLVALISKELTTKTAYWSIFQILYHYTTGAGLIETYQMSM